MKPKTELRDWSWMGLKRNPLLQVCVLLLCLRAINGIAQIHTVTNCTEEALLMAMAEGGTVTFACDGTITLTETITNQLQTVVDGTGHNIIITGSSRLFINQSSASLTLINLTLEGGPSPSGGSVFNAGGTVVLNGCQIQGNIAYSPEYDSTEPYGGAAIYNDTGTFIASNCWFRNNAVLCYPPNYDPFPPSGGAVANRGVMNLRDCTFESNSAACLGPLTPIPGPGYGASAGAIDNWGTLSLVGCGFYGNYAIAGPGGDFPGPPYYRSYGGGSADGGAMYNGGTATIDSNTFVGNYASGGQAGGPPPFGDGPAGGQGDGGAIYNAGFLIVRNSAVVNNNVTAGNAGDGGKGGTDDHNEGLPGGTGGAGGLAQGGGLYNVGTAALINCTIAGNSAAGGAAGNGGTGGDTTYVFESIPGGVGGTGGAGGSAFGGIYDASGKVAITNCTIASNWSSPGAGGSGGPGGNGSGPTNPLGPVGQPGANGVAAGLRTMGGLLVNTLLCSNNPGSNVFGVATDVGHNLSSDNSCAFTSAGSMNNTDPLLGPLADNGGPTLTMALMPGSPAIDAGNTPAAPSTDQRGFPRPVGPAADIGAYELCYIPVLQIGSPQTGTISALVYGLSGQSCRLLASDTFANWLPIATNQISPSGTTWFQDNSSITQVCRFYRVVTP